MVSSNTVLSVTGLGKKLGERVIFDRVEFELKRREIVALTGANGAGKTTLLRCLASVVRPDSGVICWLGRLTDRGAQVKRQIGFATHETFLYPQLTVEENLLFAARMHQVDSPRRCVQHHLEGAGLWRVRRLAAAQLSQGMGRRVSILRAIIHDPPIVLLDEPFSGFDEDGRHWLIDRLEKLSSGNRCVCFVTHDAHLVRKLADRNLALEAGRLHELDRPCGKIATGRSETRQVA